MQDKTTGVISINTMVEMIATKVTEGAEAFIIETLNPYCNEITRQEISKKDLERALTQYFNKQPCEDAVSREAVLEKLNELDWQELYLPIHFKEHIIDELPSVQPSRKGHCKDCKYFEYDSVAKVDGVPLIVAHEICSKWGKGCKTREDGYCFLFESADMRGNTDADSD